MGDAPLLSVVMTVVDGGATLRRCLEALTRQQDAPPLEIIVPYDDTIRDVAALDQDFPGVRFLPLGTITPERPTRSAAGQHELYDRRRAAGLAVAQGSVVAIVEDRGVPRAGWARAVVRLHEQSPGVIGGAIEPAPSSLLNWAFYVCDFGRYGLPFDSGPAGWVSDVNVSYKRAALDHTRDIWTERFREPLVHWALLERGELLYLSSEMVVDHGRPPVPLGRLLIERFHWGRLFGHIRATRMSVPTRVAFATVWPVLPLVLLLRHGRMQYRKGHLARFLRALPLIVLLLLAWTAGEAWGCLTNRA